ncbi:hypothetical protein IGI39_001290 [Enterococcus sp. AZ135]|uniref:LPXTG cell wall anchor domain-containing protein n=1 Tax=unclassified Enterococcus TaxID=2608891 RepID=UPI003F1EF4CB
MVTDPKKLDQARADFNRRIAEVEKLQEQLHADRTTIDQSVSKAKSNAQALSGQLAEGTENTQAAVSAVENRTGDIEGSINRIKAVLDSAGDDLSANGTKVEQTPVKMSVPTENAADSQQKKTIPQATEYPKTNDQANNFLSLIGFGIIGSIIFFYTRKNL